VTHPINSRLGQFEDFAFDYEAPVFDFELSFDYPEFDFTLPEELPSLPTADYVYTPEEIMPLGQDVYAVGDAAGNVYYVDEFGQTVSVEDATGTEIPFDAQAVATAEELSASYVSPDAAASDFANTFPDVDWNALLKSGVDIYKTYAQLEMSERTGTRPPTVAPAPNTRRINPATGQTEYYNAVTRQWQTTPAPMTAGAATFGTQPQIIPGVSNTALVVGAGVVALAFFMARR